MNMKARELTLSLMDMSLIFSIWGNGKLDRTNVHSAVEINDAFEPILRENGDALGAAARGGDGQEEAMKALTEIAETLTLSVPAYGLLFSAFKEHDTWTMRGARQLLRIDNAFNDAGYVDLEPKRIEE